MQKFKINVVILCDFSFVYFLIIVHLGESHMLCSKSFLRITKNIKE